MLDFKKASSMEICLVKKALLQLQLSKENLNEMLLYWIKSWFGCSHRLALISMWQTFQVTKNLQCWVQLGGPQHKKELILLEWIQRRLPK